MANPSTIKEAEALGLKPMSQEEFDQHMRLIPQAGIMRERLVNCALPENEGQLCWHIKCYFGKEVFVYCQGGRCDKQFYKDCIG